MALATISHGSAPALGDLVDGLAARTGAWVLVERFGVILAFGTGAGSCPAPVALSVLAKRTDALRSAVTWSRRAGALVGTVESSGLTVADLGEGAEVWFIGGPVDETCLPALAAAAQADAPTVHDPFVEELLHPRGPSRRGRAPRSQLVVLRSPGSPVALARKAKSVVSGTDARVHHEGDLVLIALSPEACVDSLAQRLDGVVLGVAEVAEGAADWVVTTHLAAGAALAAEALGVPVGRPADPMIAAELVVSEAQGAVADLLRDLPDAPLRRLQDHDAKVSGDLVASLTAWCRSGFDVPTAAASLHVHTNTLRYRLKRATEISGLDVTRPRQLLALQLLLAV